MSEETVKLMTAYNKLWAAHNQLCEDYDLLQAHYEECAAENESLKTNK